MHRIKIVFIGTVEFSLKALQRLIELEVGIVGVFTKYKSAFNADFASLEPLSTQNKITCRFVENINDTKSVGLIKALKPDYIFCFGWSQILGKELLDIAPVVGFHPAKLPQNRGRHPLIWALALGLERSASTFFFIDEGADSGDILSQVDFEINCEDNAKSLYGKVTNIALKQDRGFCAKTGKQ